MMSWIVGSSASVLQPNEPSAGSPMNGRTAEVFWWPTGREWMSSSASLLDMDAWRNIRVPMADAVIWCRSTTISIQVLETLTPKPAIAVADGLFWSLTNQAPPVTTDYSEVCHAIVDTSITRSPPVVNSSTHIMMGALQVAEPHRDLSDELTHRQAKDPDVQDSSDLYSPPIADSPKKKVRQRVTSSSALVLLGLLSIACAMVSYIRGSTTRNSPSTEEQHAISQPATIQHKGQSQQQLIGGQESDEQFAPANVSKSEASRYVANYVRRQFPFPVRMVNPQDILRNGVNVSDDSTDAVALYSLAIFFYAEGKLREAELAALKGIDVEKRFPIRDYGRVMERVQGPVRVWLEELRARGRTEK